MAMCASPHPNPPPQAGEGAVSACCGRRAKTSASYAKYISICLCTAFATRRVELPLPLAGEGWGGGTFAKELSQHAWQHAVRRLVIVQKSSDVDDHLLAHLDTAFDGGRAHMRQ